MRVDLVTLFPDLFRGPLDFGVLRRARAAGLVEIDMHDLRDFTHDRHRTVDDRPFGGGEGMLLKVEPVAELLATLAIAPKPSRDPARESVILLSPQGVPFTQSVAGQLAACDRLVLICGRYEGVDERVNEIFCDRELSIGDYVLSGGELAAAVIVDTVTRLLPGVLGNPDSARYESFGAADAPQPGGPAADRERGQPPRVTQGSGGLLDYPQYTRPAEFQGHAVPAPLASGDHRAVREWRRRAALRKTLRNRPDLLRTAPLSESDRAYLRELGASL